MGSWKKESRHFTRQDILTVTVKTVLLNGSFCPQLKTVQAYLSCVMDGGPNLSVCVGIGPQIFVIGGR